MATFPGVVGQIDRTRPKYVSPVDSRRKFTYFGTVSPEDRNFLANNEAGSIITLKSNGGT